MTSYWCSTALLPTGVASGVLVTIADGRFASVAVDADPGDDVRLDGLVVPGLANCHSHAFHRALRGRTGGRFLLRPRLTGLIGRHSAARQAVSSKAPGRTRSVNQPASEVT